MRPAMWPLTVATRGLTLFKSANALSRQPERRPGLIRHVRRFSRYANRPPTRRHCSGRSGLRRPFQESARRDFEPLAPNHPKLGRGAAVRQVLVCHRKGNSRCGWGVL